MQVSWHDPRLTNTVTEPTFMQLSQIWHPQLQVINRQRVSATMAAVAVVYPDGTVAQRQRLWGDFSQPLQLHDFPLDTQLFEIRIGTVGYGAEQISFDGVIQHFYQPSGNFAIERIQRLGPVYRQCADSINISHLPHKPQSLSG